MNRMEACAVAEILQNRPYLAAPPAKRKRMREPFAGATVWTIDPVLKTITSALHALGNSAEAVARKLVAMHCHGEIGNPHFCPVIVYLRRQKIGRFRVELLGYGSLEVTGNDAWSDTLRAPQAVADFQRRFDRGEFPELRYVHQSVI